MLKLTFGVLLVIAIGCVNSQQSQVWYRWRPLVADNTFVQQLYQCVRYDGVCNNDQQAIKDVLKEDVCENCKTCCIFRTEMVAEVRRKFAEIDLKNIDIEVEAVDFNGMFECT